MFKTKVRETLMRMVLEMSVMMIKTMMALSFLRERMNVQGRKPTKLEKNILEVIVFKKQQDIHVIR